MICYLVTIHVDNGQSNCSCLWCTESLDRPANPNTLGCAACSFMIIGRATTVLEFLVGPCTNQLLLCMHAA